MKNYIRVCSPRKARNVMSLNTFYHLASVLKWVVKGVRYCNIPESFILLALVLTLGSHELLNQKDLMKIYFIGIWGFQNLNTAIIFLGGYLHYVTVSIVAG